MNRVLSWPQTPIVPGLLQPLKKARAATTITERGTVRFDLPLGAVEMRLLDPAHALAAGTRVYVWWKGGGFVCAPVAEVRAEEHRARAIQRRVDAARLRLEQARQERIQRESGLMDFDAMAPQPVPPADHPLLQLR